jgi:hypothetical protein
VTVDHVALHVALAAGVADPLGDVLGDAGGAGAGGADAGEASVPSRSASATLVRVPVTSPSLIVTVRVALVAVIEP